MKIVLVILGVLVLAVVGFFGAIMVASETGGEVVTLRTQDAGGETVETRLWVVDFREQLWLRSGGTESGWYQRLVATPQIELERDGASKRYRAVPVPDPDVITAVNRLMREKYGFADRMIDLMRDPEGVVPVRLDPVR